MSRKPFRFTGESYEADRSGGFRLRRKAVFERIPAPGNACRFRTVSGREELPREEQRKRDEARLAKAGGRLSGHP